jgi:hypothetical protein
MAETHRQDIYHGLVSANSSQPSNCPKAVVSEALRHSKKFRHLQDPL